jgi:pimeloyl-ACP methyl ester carboxylesterase
MEIIRDYTDDGLNLMGVHWKVENSDTCIVCIHGMAGNIITDYFAQVLGENLSREGYGFLYGHNRGSGHISDIHTREYSEDGGNKTKRIGVTFERFGECVYDIKLWIKKAKELGYSKIILMGHSLGCNKAIHYLSNDMQTDIQGLILASPPDMVGLAKLEKYQPNYKELLQEAKQNIREGNPEKILSSLIWDWYYISSQTFLDLFEDGSPADNLPLLRNPEAFEALSKIQVPIFAFMGQNDDIEIRTLEEDLELIKQKATSSTSFTTNILEGANHTYRNKEQELSLMILEWLKKI